MINDTDFSFTTFMVTDGDWLVKRCCLLLGTSADSGKHASILDFISHAGLVNQ